MKKAVAVLLAFGLLLSVTIPGYCQPANNLYTALWDASQIKVYIADVTDSSGEAGGMLRGIKEQLEKALEERQTLNFKPVRDKNDADLIITIDVTERLWYDHDPVDMDRIPSWPGLIIDAATDEDYGRIKAMITVMKGPSKKLNSEFRGLRQRKGVLWKREISADVTVPEMTEEQSKPILEIELAHVFIRKCFGRNAKM
jgi:hypothetical protein